MANKTHPDETVLAFEPKEMNKILTTNVIGPAMMFKAYYNILKSTASGSKPCKVINVSSQLGSLERAMERRFYDTEFPVTTTSYRLSKAALNMLTRTQAAQIGVNDNIIFMCIHPGHVITDMGTSYGKRPATVDVGDACDGIITLIEKMDMSYNGTFYTWQHKEHPW